MRNLFETLEPLFYHVEGKKPANMVLTVMLRRSQNFLELMLLKCGRSNTCTNLIGKCIFSTLNRKLKFSRDLQGPTWGYPTEGAYYRDASSCDSLLAVRIPFFAIHAEDDPVCSQLIIPVFLPHKFTDSRHGGTPFT